MEPKTESGRWERLVNVYNGLNHVPKIQKATSDRYSDLVGQEVTPSDALERALVEHAFYKPPQKPLSAIMSVAADEYDLIIEGGEIWDATQKP